MIARAPFSSDFLDAAQDVVRRRTGLVFRDARRSTFGAELARAIRAARESDPDVYLARLGAEQALLDELVGGITVGETYFFREPQQFAVIREEIIPALLAGRSPRRGLRVWSAGCASGEEAYSLAIMLRELGLLDATHLVGSDICRSALARALRAKYGRWSFRGVPEDVVAAHFARKGDHFELAPRIRDGVEFRYLNLAEDGAPSLASGTCGMDLILCRNVLIYFNEETVQRVARRLVGSLSDDGWLLLGASDPPLSDLAPCEAVITRAGLAYRKRRARPPPTPPAPEEVRRPPLLRTKTPELVASVKQPDKETDQPDGDAERAVRRYAERDYADAAELAGRQLLVDGSDPALWVVLVRALANRGELEAAGRSCAAALERHRTSAELTYLHVLLLGEAGMHADAAKAARRALYLDPGFVMAHLALGTALTHRGDVSGARRAFRNAECLLATMQPDEMPPGSDGVPAGRLAEMARAQLRLVREVAV